MRSVVPLQPPSPQDLYPTTDHSFLRFRLKGSATVGRMRRLRGRCEGARHTTIGRLQHGAGSRLVRWSAWASTKKDTRQSVVVPSLLDSRQDRHVEGVQGRGRGWEGVPRGTQAQREAYGRERRRR